MLLLHGNLLSKFTTTKLGKDFDIDITDLHHKHKKDTPSGTAKFIQEEKNITLHQIKPAWAVFLFIAWNIDGADSDWD